MIAWNSKQVVWIIFICMWEMYAWIVQLSLNEHSWKKIHRKRLALFFFLPECFNSLTSAMMFEQMLQLELQSCSNILISLTGFSKRFKHITQLPVRFRFFAKRKISCDSFYGVKQRKGTIRLEVESECLLGKIGLTPHLRKNRRFTEHSTTKLTAM